MKIDELLFDLDMAIRETSGHRDFFDLNDYADEISSALDLLPRIAAVLREIEATEIANGTPKEVR